MNNPLRKKIEERDVSEIVDLIPGLILSPTSLVVNSI